MIISQSKYSVCDQRLSLLPSHNPIRLALYSTNLLGNLPIPAPSQGNFLALTPPPSQRPPPLLPPRNAFHPSTLPGTSYIPPSSQGASSLLTMLTVTFPDPTTSPPSQEGSHPGSSLGTFLPHHPLIDSHPPSYHHLRGPFNPHSIFPEISPSVLSS